MNNEQLTMNKSEYIDGVMARLNELSWDDSSSGMFLGGDVSKTERLVDSLFVDGWRRGVDLLPRHWFNQSSFVRSPHYADVASGTGFVVLPVDFYVLASFRMEGWRKGVFRAVEEDDTVLAVQSNEFVRGNVCRPVCTVCVHPVYGRVLKYYSLPRGTCEHVVAEAMYVGLPGSLESVVESLGSQLVGALMWLNASVVLSVMEKVELGKVAEERALLSTNYTN